jgi:hypothetical protein
MRKMILTGSLLLAAGMVHASPYFRPVDFRHPQPVGGALIDPVHPGNTTGAGLLPIFTHSPKDGCLLPSIVCEDWTPLAVGFSGNAGDWTFDAAPLANVLPWMQAGLSRVIPQGWALHDVVAYQPGEDFITFSAGPAWEYRASTNRGYFKIFTGVALHF